MPLRRILILEVIYLWYPVHSEAIVPAVTKEETSSLCSMPKANSLPDVAKVGHCMSSEGEHDVRVTLENSCDASVPVLLPNRASVVARNLREVVSRDTRRIEGLRQ